MQIAFITIYMYTTLRLDETINMLDKDWDDTTPDYPASNNGDGGFRKRTLNCVTYQPHWWEQM